MKCKHCNVNISGHELEYYGVEICANCADNIPVGDCSCGSGKQRHAEYDAQNIFLCEWIYEGAECVNNELQLRVCTTIRRLRSIDGRERMSKLCDKARLLPDSLVAK